MSKVASKEEHFYLERKTVVARDFRPLVSDINNLTVHWSPHNWWLHYPRLNGEHLIGLWHFGKRVFLIYNLLQAELLMLIKIINNWIGSVGVVKIKNFDWQATVKQFRRICHVCREANHFDPQCPKRLAGVITPKVKSESDKRKNSVHFNYYGTQLLKWWI